MNFKKFIIGEAFDNSNVEIGDILTYLQNIKPDIDQYVKSEKKKLISMMEELVNKIRSLLSAKNDPALISVVQRVASAIIDDIKESGDFKDTIDSSIFELENYLKSKKLVLNKPTKIPEKSTGNSDPVLPADVKKNSELGPAPEEPPSYVPPLAGSGENTTPIV